MKSFQIITHRALTFGIVAWSGILVAHAHQSASFDLSSLQTPATTQTPAARPNTNAPQAAQTQPNSRERRATAYAKLLEGQRYLVASRTGSLSSRRGLNAAKSAFEAAIASDPTLDEAHTALAEVAFFSEDIAGAERAAKEAVRLNPNSFGAHKLLSRIYAVQTNLREGKLDKAFTERAIAELREVVRLNPNDGEAYLLLGEFYQATDRNDEAIEAFRRATAAPPSTDTRFLQAITGRRDVSAETTVARLIEALLRAGRANEALEIIRGALALDPTDTRNLELLGAALASGTSDPQPIIAELQRAVTIDPNNTIAVTILARTQARANQTDAAIKTLRDGITLRAANETKNVQELLELRFILAGIYADAMRPNDARLMYEEILTKRNITNTLLTSPEDKRLAAFVFPRIIELERQAKRGTEARAAVNRLRNLLGADDPTADIQFVALLREEGKRQEALAAARAARAKYPNQEQLQRLEAAALADAGQVEEAVAILRKRLNNSPTDYEEYLYIANTYLQAGLGKEAVEAARKAVELAPADRPDLLTQARVLLSSAQERAGDAKGSEESLRLVLKAEPNNATALNNLGYFLVERNERLEEALELIQRALRAEPFNSSFLDSLGWAYFKLNRLQEAERYLSEAARRNASSATVQEHLGDVYNRLGRKNESRAAWQKALSLSVEADEMTRLKTKINESK